MLAARAQRLLCFSRRAPLSQVRATLCCKSSYHTCTGATWAVGKATVERRSARHPAGRLLTTTSAMGEADAARAAAK